jgi:hypothetical protein
MVNSKIKNIIKKLILEAYVNAQGQLQDFNPFPYDMELDKGGVSPFYDPELPKGGNRFKDTINQGQLATLTIEIPRQQRAFQKAVSIASKGAKFGKEILKPNFQLSTIGNGTKNKIHKYKFNIKFVPFIKQILLKLSQEDSLSNYVDDYKELASMIR